MAKNRCEVPENLKWCLEDIFATLDDWNKTYAELEGELEWLISSPNSKENAPEKQKTIERICELVAKELSAQGLSDYNGNEAEGHAYSVNNKITDPNIRNLHILYGV